MLVVVIVPILQIRKLRPSDSKSPIQKEMSGQVRIEQGPLYWVLATKLLGRVQKAMLCQSATVAGIPTRIRFRP